MEIKWKELPLFWFWLKIKALGCVNSCISLDTLNWGESILRPRIIEEFASYSLSKFLSALVWEWYNRENYRLCLKIFDGVIVGDANWKAPVSVLGAGWAVVEFFCIFSILIS